jgi:cytochrome c-type biogenesis protein CcmH/NrfF
VAAASLAVRQIHAQAAVQGPGGAAPAADPLREQDIVGRLRDSITALDNDPVIVALERRLRCTCGCTLDVYTCRTTDFTCTYSPAMHREVLDLYKAGKTPDEIVQAFVAREGEQILMAPPAEGFNLAGYLVPGLVMVAGALGLAAWITRRKQLVAATSAASLAARPVNATAGPNADQLDALRRALDEVDS